MKSTIYLVPESSVWFRCGSGCAASIRRCRNLKQARRIARSIGGAFGVERLQMRKGSRYVTTYQFDTGKPVDWTSPHISQISNPPM